LDPLKRVDRIIDAFLRMPDKHLIVVSGGCDEPRLRKRAGNAPNITFTGWISDEHLFRLLGECIATVYIPVNEDFGISPVESMAAGKPVIGVREGGLCETIVDGSTGWLLDPQLAIDDVVAAVGACTVERAVAMREACEQRSRLFTEEVFRMSLLGALEQRAIEKGLVWDSGIRRGG
jgi:glycosyltransferase involved in cell wall biosynthesis